MLTCNSLISRYLFFVVLVTAVVLSAEINAKTNIQTDIKTIAESNWLEHAQNEIKNMEYQTSVTRKGLQSPNRAHNLRIYYTEQGISIHDRTAQGEPLLVGMRLGLYGRVGDLKRMTPVKPEHDKTHVLYRHSDSVQEWYNNSDKGLEHGFHLNHKPSGPGELQLQIDLWGAETDHKAQAVSLHTATGRRLQYGALKVFDANGKSVPAQMHAKKQTIVLSIDDSEAVWPLLVDPLLTATFDSLVTGQGDNYAGFGARFGHSLAYAGDVNGDGFGDVVIGSPGHDQGEDNEGITVVYYGSIDGISATSKTVLQINLVGAGFGRAVAAAGDVNGDGYDDIATSGGGLSYVYYGGADGVDSNNYETRQYSGSVAGAGDVNGDGYSDIVIGDPNFTHTNQVGLDAGAAFIYHGSATGLGSGVTTLKLQTISCTLRCSEFGASVSSAGDVNGDGYSDVIVRAARLERVYVYLGSSTGIDPNYQVSMKVSQTNSNFGESLSSAGDVNGDGYDDIIVGANNYKKFSNRLLQWFNYGRAFVYLGSAAGIVSTPSVELEDKANAYFGSSVSSLGDVNGDGFGDVIVGAYLYTNPESAEGAAFIYYGSINGIDINPSTVLESNADGSAFGYSASGGDVNGDGYSDVIVGAPTYGAREIGGGFVYYGGAQGISDTASVRLESNQTSAAYGFSVSDAGDVNADGFGDVVIGSYLFDNGETDEGSVFVYHGSRTGLGLQVNEQLEFNLAGAYFGRSVSGAGDVNGDGYSDIVIGSTADAFLYYGGVGGFNTTAAVQLGSAKGSEPYGTNVSDAGDVNGDGYSDVMVGVYSIDALTSNEDGVVYIFHGGSTGIRVNASTQLIVDQRDSLFGTSVSGAGDLNGDGYSDVIIGASLFDNSEVDEGAAFVFYGSTGGINVTSRVTLDANQTGAAYGRSVSGAGDVNGDGYSDVLVGAPTYENGQLDEGAVFVYHGGAGGINTVFATQLEADQMEAGFGSSVSGVGDVNGDGFGDLIVGAYLYDNGQSNEGAAFMYHGTTSGVNPVADVQLESNQTDARFGISVSGAGDINGDGFSDAIVGADGFGSGQLDEGASFVFLGNNGGAGRLVQVRQFRQNTTAVPVASLGASQSSGQYTVSMMANYFRARGAVKLQIETCPKAVAFGHASCELTTSLDWALVAHTGALLNQVVNTPGEGLYQWRARVLHADETMLKPGIVTPPNPKHGAWHRLEASANNADIRVTNFVNDTPVIEAGTGSFSVAEDASPGTVVTVIAATDADGTSPDYSITLGNDTGDFAIDATGNIKVAKSLDYETTQSYSLTIGVSDGVSSTSGVVDINIGNINDNSPSIAGGLGAFTMVDSAAVNTPLTRIIADDLDGDTLVYNIVLGNESNDFAIDSNGIIVVARALNFNITPSYELWVAVSDGTFATEGRVSVVVTDRNAPIFTNDTWGFSLPEDTTVGSVITTLTATDLNDASLSFGIRDGNTAGKFNINSGTGEVTIASALDFEISQQYTLTVTVTDASSTAVATLTINVSNVTELPVFVNDTWSYTLAEDAAVDTIVTTLVATDPNSGTPVYDIVAGNDSGDFTINTETGAITIAKTLDFETLSTYSLTVTASVSEGSTEATLNINISDVIEALPEPKSQSGANNEDGGGSMSWLLLFLLVIYLSRTVSGSVAEIRATHQRVGFKL